MGSKLLFLSAIVFFVFVGQAHAQNVDCRAVETERVKYVLGDLPDSGGQMQQELFGYHWYYCSGNGPWQNGPVPAELPQFRSTDPNYPNCLELTRQVHTDKSLSDNKDVVEYLTYWCYAHDIGGVGAVAQQLVDRQQAAAQQQAEAQQQAQAQQQEDVGAEIAQDLIVGVISGLIGSHLPGASNVIQHVRPNIAQIVRPSAIVSHIHIPIPPPHLPSVLHAYHQPTPTPPPAAPKVMTLHTNAQQPPSGNGNVANAVNTKTTANLPKGTPALEGAQACSYIHSTYVTAALARNSYIAGQSAQTYNQYCGASAMAAPSVANVAMATATKPAIQPQQRTTSSPTGPIPASTANQPPIRNAPSANQDASASPVVVSSAPSAISSAATSSAVTLAMMTPPPLPATTSAPPEAPPRVATPVAAATGMLSPAQRQATLSTQLVGEWFDIGGSTFTVNILSVNSDNSVTLILPTYASKTATYEDDAFVFHGVSMDYQFRLLADGTLELKQYSHRRRQLNAQLIMKRQDSGITTATIKPSGPSTQSGASTPQLVENSNPIEAVASRLPQPAPSPSGVEHLIAPLPSRISITVDRADPNLSSSLTQFLGVWEGYWSTSKRPANLIITSVDASGQIIGYYSWGAGNGFRYGHGYLPIIADIQNGSFSLPTHDNFVLTFRATSPTRIEGQETSDGKYDAGIIFSKVE